MNQNDSNWIKGFFAARSLDLTPAPVRHAAHILYAPVSTEPLVTGCCASILSATELQMAERFAIQDDRSQFIQRRAFRRFCGARALNASWSLSEVAFEETENGRPWLPDLPGFRFSFSSCRFGILGAWSPTHGIGVDIEDRTRDPGTTELARQYFSESEATAIAAHAGPANLRAFFGFWTLKEAALKSIGEGIPFGLDAFEFELNPDPCVVHAPHRYGGAKRFNAHVMERNLSCIAMVLRNDPG
jgi:phosphopantetheinyl transferase